MKIELPVQIPSWIKESWEGQFEVFPWYYFAIDLPSPIFIITTLKDNGLANAQLSTWGMIAGSGNEPKFILMVHNYTETRKLIEKTGEFVINFPDISLKNKFRNTINPFDSNTDEIIASGLQHDKPLKVKAPRVKECFAHLECKLDWIRDIEKETKSTSLVQGSIVHAAIDENVLSDDLKTTCENRKWVFNVHEMVNPKTGNHGTGFLTTLDMNSRVKIED
ncbi:flavin reductase family protein [Lutispora sp.]|uniref:flavin reductase family protein n=1 Tax=Lutispora sp. TaxID=2828727 RepID=UPI002B1FF6CF|nr:flavin reductase family protein [Lutispora sp.]MEA4961103.1 flavin reductase family protein [Lutispora sp.]